MANAHESRGGRVTDVLRVDGVTALSSDVVSVRLVHPTGADLPAWAPGDHVDIELAPGLTRQYSLCGVSTDTAAWTVAVRLDPDSRGGSRFVHNELAAGELVRVAGPKSRFPLDDASEHVLIAGGIGLTPILTMAESLHAQSRPFRVIYFERGVERMVYRERLEALGASAVVVDRSADATLTLAGMLAERNEGALVYACGPKRMLEELSTLVPADALRIEDFAPAAAEPAVVDDEPEDVAASDEFEVQLGAGGAVHPVPSGCSLLDVLLAAGVDVMWSCREGNCASCETVVLDGTPEHRDVILTDEERAAGDVIFPCVSRSRTPRLVLDV